MNAPPANTVYGGRVFKSDAISFQETVSVKVGNEQSIFVVHESVLFKSSEFFQTALKAEWDAARKEPRIINLSEEDTKFFSIYVNWLYTKKFPTVDATTIMQNEEYLDLANCYILGEMLQDIDFKNAVLEALIDAIINNQAKQPRSKPSVAVVDKLYDNTPEGSPARKLLVSVWAALVSGADALLYPQLPEEFAKDLLTEITKTRLNRSRTDYPWGNMSLYREAKQPAPDTKQSA